MNILIGSDHGGYKLKEWIKKELDKNNLKYQDVGVESDKSVDYPDIAKKISSVVSKEPKKNIGILICGTGIGMSLVANKYKNVRAALCHNKFTSTMAREHNNANILCMGGRVVNKKTGIEIVKTFIETPFSNEQRHKRRVRKIE